MLAGVEIEGSHLHDQVGGASINGVDSVSLGMTDAVSTENGRQMHEIWIYSITGALLIGLSGIFPLLVIPLESGPALKQGEAAKKLRLMLSFAVGSLLGDVFLHLLPEVWAHMDRNSHTSHLKIGLWVVSGLLSFMIIEKIMGNESEFEHLHDTCDESSLQDEDQKMPKPGDSITMMNLNRNPEACTRRQKNKCEQKSSKKCGKSTINEKLNKVVDKVPISRQDTDNNIKVSGYLNLLANVVDNFTHGLAVSASFCISTKVGLITTLAILLHEIPHEVGDFAILLRSGFDRWKAAKAQFLTALGGVIGAVTTLTTESVQVAGERAVWVLPFTSGGFMYIALVTVVPDLLQEKHGWESTKQVACVCFGVLSMIIVTVAFE